MAGRLERSDEINGSETPLEIVVNIANPAKLKILVVDDNPQDRRLVIRELRKTFPDAELLEALDQTQFDAHLAQRRFDLVVTDYHLKWSDGIRILRTVKQAMPYCPVIMFTGTGNEEIAVEAMKHGLDDYIIKNVQHLVRLRGAVHSALKNAGIRIRAEHLAAQLQTILSSIRIGVFSASLEGRFIDANRVMLDMLGCSSLIMASRMSIADFMQSSEHWESLRRRLEQAQAVEEIEFSRTDSTGQTMWYRLAARRILLETGDARIDGLVEDVSRQKQQREMERRAAIARAQIAMLSPREKDVLRGVVRGWPNKTIARRLDISEKTVEKHRSNLMKKLALKSVAELVRLAVAADLPE